MASGDRKKSRDEREKERREERRRALSARLGGAPPRPGAKAADAEAEEAGKSAPERPEPTARRAAEKPEKPDKPDKPREKSPGRRFWQRGSKADQPRTRRTEKPRNRRAEEPKAESGEKPKPRGDAEPTARRGERPKSRSREEQPKSRREDRPKAGSREKEPKSRREESRKARREEKPEPGRDEEEAKPRREDKPRSRRRAEPRARRDKGAPSGRPARRGEKDERPSRSPRRKSPTAADHLKALRKQGGSAVAAGRKALGEGAAATQRRAKAARPALAEAGKRSWALLAPLLGLVFLAIARGEKGTRTGLRAAGSGLATATRLLDRLVTPRRAALLVTLATVTCLIVSQYQDYRGVEVGQPGYVDVASIVGADQVDVEDPRAAHGVALLAVAGGAALLALGAMATRRRFFGLLISLLGIVGVLICVLVDREEGLDAGQTAVAYAGTNAVLLDGFFAQLAACGVLIACGVLLSIYAPGATRREAGAAGRSGRRRPRPRPGGGRPLAESGT